MLLILSNIHYKTAQKQCDVKGATERLHAYLQTYIVPRLLLVGIAHRLFSLLQTRKREYRAKRSKYGQFDCNFYYIGQ